MALAKRIVAWSLKEMQSPSGFYFYQKKRFFKNRIPYMRWSQAWMLLALSTLLAYCERTGIDQTEASTQ
jgi:hypothetical protein